MSVLDQQVYAADGYKRFGEFTLEEVRSRAQELRQATGWGPTARVGAVARGWGELGAAMSAAGAGTVDELGAEVAGEFARRTWVVSPL